ncbi:MAG: pirin family protein [Planctomycetes bacterium]|nr:pirin family protein [Planctomycetota bacterium]
MIRIRKAEDRGHADHGWLNTWHTFSFADYHDGAHVHFRGLRVMNEDYIAGGRGFGMHPHRDMEIVTYVMQGALEHRDSMGNHGVIKPGVVQRMSAGTGVLHSEANPTDETTHLYQIWIFPREKGVQPGYEEKLLPEAEPGKWVLVASPDGADGSVTINADTKLWAARLEAGQSLDYELPHGHAAWLQVTRGRLTLNDEALETSDGAAVEEVGALSIKAETEVEFLLFDLD